jgi:hypothetical protein
LLPKRPVTLLDQRPARAGGKVGAEIAEH